MARHTFQRGWVERIERNGKVKFRACGRERDPISGQWSQRKKIVPGCKSEKEALEHLSKAMPLVNEENNSRNLYRKAILFAEFTSTRWVAYLENEETEESTISSYNSMLKKHILPRFGQAPINGITTDALTAFFESLRPKCSKKYAINIYSLLSVMFDVALEYGYIQSVPLSKKLHRPRQKNKEREEKSALSVENAKLVLQFIPPEYKLLVVLLATTGLRIGELLGLRRVNFDSRARELRITHNLWRGRLKTTKTPASKATFELPEAIAELLNANLSRSLFRQSNDFIFHRPDGSPLDPDWIRESVLYPALDAAGIKRLPRHHGWHLLRHSAGSILICAYR